MSIVLRKATARDRPEIAATHVAAIRGGAREHYTPEEIAAWSAGKDPERYPVDSAEMFVATCDERVVGFGELHVGHAARGEVRAVYVRPEAAGRGVGRQLLALLEEVARARGVARLTLGASLNAVGFYARHGFVSDGPDASTTANGVRIPSVRMAKPLRLEPRGPFSFLDPGPLVDGALTLTLEERRPAEPARGYVPAYHFAMRVDGVADPVGTIQLRPQSTDRIVLYRGHIGYTVDPAHRGHRYAARSVRLLAPLCARHGVSPVWITCDPANDASRRSAERAGAVLESIVALPEDEEMYQLGERLKCRYRL